QSGDSQKEALAKQESFWLNQFEGEFPSVQLPTDYPRTEEKSSEGGSVEFELGSRLTLEIKNLMAKENVTLYMVMLALYNILLMKLTGLEDIAVGTAISGRRHPDLKEIIGMFVNTLVLRNFPVEEKYFTAFLKEIKQRTIAAFDNQDYLFEDLMKKVVIDRRIKRRSFYDVSFAVGNIDSPELEIPGLSLRPYPYENNVSKDDLTFQAMDGPGGIEGIFMYCSRLFKKESIELMRDRFIVLVGSVLDNSETAIRDLEYRLPVERELEQTSDIEFDF
ncbi:MAG: non-ribosomal peptide synthetase, partial [bacterium]|nr:non-ribosomal peptide synthetase [bacterium]